jgi:hypothetical protein
MKDERLRAELQQHLDEVIFYLLLANPTWERMRELIAIRMRIEDMLDEDSPQRGGGGSLKGRPSSSGPEELGP